MTLFVYFLNLQKQFEYNNSGSGIQQM